jgi:hypothetical protein
MMRQKPRADVLRGLLIALITLVVAAPVQAQVQHIDFQVIHMPRHRGLPEAPYVAIRTVEAWDALWPESSTNPNAPPIPKIDFTKFILLIAQTGVRPSSGYKIIFDSVDVAPAASNKMATTVHIVEMAPGNCPALAHLADSVSYALIPQTTNEIRFIVSKADSDCNEPVTPPFIK